MYKILVIGNGFERNNIEEQIISIGLNRDVILTGFRQVMSDLLQIMYIFIHPTILLKLSLLQDQAAQKN